jgi:hypothetical protein
MKKYQGEDIHFSLNFNTSTNSDITSFNDFQNVIIYAYTQDTSIAKFSVLSKDGYSPLVDPDGGLGMILKGSIKSSYTKDMSGQVILDVMCIRPTVDGDLTDNLIQKVNTGIFIIPSIIKVEA